MGCSCSSNFSGTEEAQSEQLTTELYNEWLLAEGSHPACCEFGGACPEGFKCVGCGCIPKKSGEHSTGQVVYGGGVGRGYRKLTNPLGFAGQEKIKSGVGSMVPWVVLAVSLGVGLYVSNIVIKKE